ncbi:hypothetical protein ACQBAT_03600 [Ornithinimicrobium sp. Y1847]|uniref:hypothetical protein n=1 Tax=Ornithinimicrobium sp. Y1847 TaxID=3405419 RepID=UPI003B678166
MKFSRFSVAVAMSSALVVSACTGADTPADTAPATAGTADSTEDAEATQTTEAPADEETETATGDAAQTTGDAADTTAGADDAAVTGDAATTTAMTTDAGTADLSVEDAEQIAAAVLEDRLAYYQADDDEREEALELAYDRSAMEAARGVMALRGVTGDPAEVEAEEPAEANVLAISREDDTPEQLILVQTVPEDEVPLLHLMASEDGESSNFRIIWEAPMLPGTSVPTFDRRSVGSPTQDRGAGDLAEAPRDTLRTLAGYINWPQPDETPDYRTHGYSPAVRRAAESQAAAVEGQATLQERNWLVSDDIRTLLFEDGSAFIMGSLLRDTKFTVNQGAVLTPPEAFTVFADSDSLSQEAVLRTTIMVGMRAPSEEVEFKPEMIAAREQLIDAWGS